MKKVIFGTLQSIISFAIMVLSMHFSKYLDFSLGQFALVGSVGFVLTITNIAIGVSMIIKGHKEMGNIKDLF